VENGVIVSTGAWLDLPAFAIAALVTVILIRGIRESAMLNTIMVIIKLAVVLFVIIAGIPYVKISNWTDNFAPYGYGGVSFFGHLVWGETNPATGLPAGVMAGAALIFFAYLGFDAVSTSAEEAKKPEHDVPFVLSVHSSFARSCISLLPPSLPAWFPTTKSRKKPPWPMPSNRLVSKGHEFWYLLAPSPASRRFCWS
jgi:amino acid permease